jgi:hypothetical protein
MLLSIAADYCGVSVALSVSGALSDIFGLLVSVCEVISALEAGVSKLTRPMAPLR